MKLTQKIVKELLDYGPRTHTLALRTENVAVTMRRVCRSCGQSTVAIYYCSYCGARLKLR
jgi:hypothetical protein